MKKFLTLIILSFLIGNLFSQEEIKEPDTYTVVDTMPVFSKNCDLGTLSQKSECSMIEIQKYVGKVPYPQEAIDKDLEGKVYIRFIVGKKGEIESIKLLRSCGYKILDNTVLEHIKKMPSFYQPGYKNSKAVKIIYNLPVVYKLSLKSSKKRIKRTLKRGEKAKSKIDY